MSPFPTTKKTGFSSFKRVATVTTLTVLLLGTALTSIKTAHAGLFSFLSTVMGNQQVSADTKQPIAADSQVSSVIVLQASAMSPTIASSVSANPPIQDQTTLSADMARMNATSTDDVNTLISVYVVRPGDSLSSVADMFNVSINTILWANDLTSKSILKQGQTLVILPVTGISYTVKKGDTIQAIARKYGADVDEILSYNDITLATTLGVGDQILIPDSEIAAPVVKTTSSGSRTITKAPNEPLLDGWGWPSYPGFFSCPVPGSRVSQNLHGHNGVDLAAPKGTPILAAAGGTIIVARANGAWNGGYGNFVVVLHGNGTQTLYAHMSKSTVSNGQAVTKGQVIGYIGMTGLTTGPHVHFEVRGAQNPTDDPALCR
ncbi:MAG TPA: peptidoglycan DD-metalloendopeptidase family protein [Candidatus Paceibacterota bacterium]